MVKYAEFLAVAPDIPSKTQAKEGAVGPQTKMSGVGSSLSSFFFTPKRISHCDRAKRHEVYLRSAYSRDVPEHTQRPTVEERDTRAATLSSSR